MIRIFVLAVCQSVVTAAPTCTSDLCCTGRYGFCEGNTHAAPVAPAAPVALSRVGSDNVVCGAGYEDKANKATIVGTNIATCCDVKTCTVPTAFDCGAVTKRAKSSPATPATGVNPTETNCCEAITGMCSGNTGGTGNVNCGAGYENKANKASIPGTDVATCCDAKTCTAPTAYNCAAVNKQAKSSPTTPAAGVNPTETDCCEAITGKCTGNTGGTGNVVCGAGYRLKSTASAITGSTQAACCDQNLQCLGNTGGGDVSCPSGFVNKGSSISYASSDTTNILKYAKCCQRPKCVKSVAAVAASCNVASVSAVTGTCDGDSTLTEKANIENLPADPSDWASATVVLVNTDTCCIRTTGQCTGNTGGIGNVVCGTGYQDKSNKASLAGANPAACCDVKTCTSPTAFDCAALTKKAKSSPTAPAAGVNPTATDCCEAITGKCTGNTGGTGNVVCGAGYYDKANKANIVGTDVATCCNAKTCTAPTAYNCAGVTKRAKSSPATPATGANPTQTDCCEAITGMCSGNTGGTGDVVCGAGYENKANKASIAGTDVAACCVVKTCKLPTAYNCAAHAGQRAKSVYRRPAFGVDPTASDCCEPITGMCAGNAAGADVACTGTWYQDKADKSSITGSTQAACCDAKLNRCMSHRSAGVPYACGNNLVAQALSSVAAVTGQCAQSCSTAGFTRTARAGVAAYGPVCPDPDDAPAVSCGIGGGGGGSGSGGGGSGTTATSSDANCKKFKPVAILGVLIGATMV